MKAFDVSACSKARAVCRACRPLLVAVEGVAELIRDGGVFEAHWTEDFDCWFLDGIDTQGVVLIMVHAERVHWWDGENEGELVV